MGKVIRFEARSSKRKRPLPLVTFHAEQAGKSLERSLVKVFSSLSSAGMPEMALDALVRWGGGAGHPRELLESVQSLAAVSGVRLPWLPGEGASPEWYPS